MPRLSNPSPVPPRDPRAWVELWSRSGLSARAFAAQHGLVMSTLYGWRRQLRRYLIDTLEALRTTPHGGLAALTPRAYATHRTTRVQAA